MSIRNIDSKAVPNILRTLTAGLVDLFLFAFFHCRVFYFIHKFNLSSLFDLILLYHIRIKKLSLFGKSLVFSKDFLTEQSCRYFIENKKRGRSLAPMNFIAYSASSEASSSAGSKALIDRLILFLSRSISVIWQSTT